jgi:hypothetical protein
MCSVKLVHSPHNALALDITISLSWELQFITEVPKSKKAESRSGPALPKVTTLKSDKPLVFEAPGGRPIEWARYIEADEDGDVTPPQTL